MTAAEDWKRIAGTQQSRADRLQSDLEHANTALAWAIETLTIATTTLAQVQTRTAATIAASRRPTRRNTR